MKSLVIDKILCIMVLNARGHDLIFVELVVERDDVRVWRGAGRGFGPWHDKRGGSGCHGQY